MSEITIVFVSLAKLILVGLTATCYSLGGRDNVPKWIRRFIAPAVLFGGVFGFSYLYNFNHLSMGLCCLGGYAVLALGFSLGYSGSTQQEKAIRRAIAGFVSGFSGVFICIVSGHWALFVIQLMLATLVSIILGLINPVEAAEEEILICTLYTIFVPFML